MTTTPWQLKRPYSLKRGATSDTDFVRQLDAGLDPVYPLIIRSLRAKNASANVFEGVTKFLTNSLEDAFNDHLKHSFQSNAKLKIEAWIDEDGKWRAYGVIFMELPKLDREVRTALWQHVAVLPSFREMILATDDPDAVGVQLIPHAIRPIRSVNPSWSCRCSQTTVENMLVTLNIEEVRDMVRDDKPLDIRCHYCNKNYFVSNERQKELLASMAPIESQSKIKN
jgi:molecular chaperone Hsp33